MSVTADRPAPRVSVIMSVYNGACHLRPAVDSILNQTLTDYEFIIVDDASTDSAPQVLEEYADPRIVRLANPSNLGLAGSLNRGLAAARGGYVARQDADDVSMPGRLALQVAYLDDHPRTGFVGTTAIWMDEAGSDLQVWRQPTEPPDVQERLLWYCPIVHGSVMMRREAVLEVRGYDEGMRTGQDYDLWLRLAERWDGAVLPEPLYRYRWHEAMMSKVRGPEQTANVQAALQRSLTRRTALARDLLSPVRSRLEWTGRYSRSEWALRFLYWAAGSRSVGQGYPRRFAVTSFLLNPVSGSWWRFMLGVARRSLVRTVRATPEEQRP